MNTGLLAGLPRIPIGFRGAAVDPTGSTSYGDGAPLLPYAGATFLGYQAGVANRLTGKTGQNGGTGSGNTFIGYQAGTAETSGDSNVMIGYQAGSTATTAYQSVLIGYLAGIGNTTGITNAQGEVCIGYFAACNNSNNAVAIGAGALAGASGAVAIGATALTGGSNSIVIGSSAGNSGLTATGTICIGELSGASNTSGVNTMVGFQSGRTATSGNATTSGTRQTLIGFNAGQTVSTQLNDIVCVGDTAQAGGGTSVAIGSSAWAYTDCISIGYQAGLSTATGANNVFIGYQAGHALTGSVFYVTNTFVGYAAGSAQATGLNNTLIGGNAGLNMIGGSECTHIGCNAGQVTSGSSFSNTTSLGYATTVGAAGGVAIGSDSAGNGATTSVANQIVLGTTNHTTLFPGNVVYTVNTPTVTAGAVTVLANSRVSNIVVSAGTAITISTTGALDSMEVTLRITDGGTPEALTYVNTENSTVSPPANSPGSATLPRTVGFQFNGMTSKWRCILNV